MFLDAVDQMKFAGAMSRLALTSSTTMLSAATATVGESCGAVAQAYGPSAAAKAKKKSGTAKTRSAGKTKASARQTKQVSSPAEDLIELAFAPMKLTLEAMAPKAGEKPTKNQKSKATRSKAKSTTVSTPLWAVPVWGQDNPFLSQFKSGGFAPWMSPDFFTGKKQPLFQPALMAPWMRSEFDAYDVMELMLKPMDAFAAMVPMTSRQKVQPFAALPNPFEASATIIPFPGASTRAKGWAGSASPLEFGKLQSQQIAAGMAAFAAALPMLQAMQTSPQWPFLSA